MQLGQGNTRVQKARFCFTRNTRQKTTAHLAITPSIPSPLIAIPLPQLDADDVRPRDDDEAQPPARQAQPDNLVQKSDSIPAPCRHSFGQVWAVLEGLVQDDVAKLLEWVSTREGSGGFRD